MFATPFAPRALRILADLTRPPMTAAALFTGIALSALTVLPAQAESQEQHAGPSQTAPRVISTDAGITAIVEALEAGDSLVAIDVTSAGHPGLPRVGYHRALSAEGLLSLKPDLVLASEHAGPPSTLSTLRKLGVDVTQLPAPLSVQDLAGNIAAIGSSLNRENAAKTLLRQLDSRARAIAARGESGASALLVRENDGVIRVAGANTAGDALLELVGARNLADFSGYRSYSVEALLTEDPQILVIAAGTGERPEEWIERYPLLQHSQAVRSGRLLAVRGSSLVGGLSLTTLSEAEALLDALSRSAMAAR